MLLVGSLGVARSWAQPESAPRREGRPSILIELAMQKAVQEELKLSTDEVDRLKRLAGNEQDSPPRESGDREGSRRDRRKRMQEKSAEDESCRNSQARTVPAAQTDQLAGARARRLFKNPSVVSALALTDKQTEGIDTILLKNQGEGRKLFQEGGLKQGDTEEVKAYNRKLMAKVRNAAVEEIVALLTPDQQAKWKELIGEPFTGDFAWSDFGPRGGGRHLAGTEVRTCRGVSHLRNFRRY